MLEVENGDILLWLIVMSFLGFFPILKRQTYKHRKLDIPAIGVIKDKVVSNQVPIWQISKKLKVSVVEIVRNKSSLSLDVPELQVV